MPRIKDNATGSVIRMARKKPTKHKFATEGELCDAFLKTVPDVWEVYAETAGYDIVLAHKETEFQIAIEAKLRLNPKVLCQVLKGSRIDVGPDVLAVLVNDCSPEMVKIAQKLGVTVIVVDALREGERGTRYGWNNGDGWASSPTLPVVKKSGNYVPYGESTYWQDLMPEFRLKLPDYIPDVKAGRPSPLILSDWKIASMKMIMMLDKLGYITRGHFKALGLNQSFWLDHKHLVQGSERGQWVTGPYMKGQRERLQSSHPKVWKQILESFGDWSAKLDAQKTKRQKAR